MLDEIKKSLNSVLNERIISPLFGTFIFSWCVWNWKIIYLTLFVSEDIIQTNRIDYIVKNYSDPWYLFWFPLISTILLLVVYPFFSIGAYYISLRFKKWKITIRNIQENKQVLTIEESIELREEIRNQEIKFDELLKGKDKEIEKQKSIIENYKNQLTTLNKGVSFLPEESRDDIYKEEYETLKRNDLLFKQFKLIAPKAQKETTMFTENTSIDRKMFDYFMAND